MPSVDGSDAAATLRSVGRLIVSYVIGLVLTGVLMLPYAGLLALFLVLGGLVIALPFLGIAIITLILFRSSITRNLAAWCVIAPVVVMIAWLFVEYGTQYSQRGFSPLAYLSFRSVLERALMALTSASIASAIFYRHETPDQR